MVTASLPSAYAGCAAHMPSKVSSVRISPMRISPPHKREIPWFFCNSPNALAPVSQDRIFNQTPKQGSSGPSQGLPTAFIPWTTQSVIFVGSFCEVLYRNEKFATKWMLVSGSTLLRADCHRSRQHRDGIRTTGAVTSDFRVLRNGMIEGVLLLLMV